MNLAQHFWYQNSGFKEKQQRCHVQNDITYQAVFGI